MYLFKYFEIYVTLVYFYYYLRIKANCILYKHIAYITESINVGFRIKRYHA